MTKLKQWLYQRLLPAWCRDDLMETNTRLAEKVQAQQREIEQLNAYIGGLETAMRSRQHITIRNEVSKP